MKYELKMFIVGEVKLFSTNRYVKSLSAKGITYTDGLNQLFIASNQQVKLPGDIFERPVDLMYRWIGMTRIESSGEHAYLSTIKDSTTNEVLSYHVKERMTRQIPCFTYRKIADSR
ncbi:hypothetical protein V4D07_17885 [Paenibacillus taichungensis]